MRSSNSLRQLSGPALGRFSIGAMRVPRHFMLGVILIFALLAFEAFNFDTTRFALQDLMGDVRFAGIAWATILAIAFCAIDFAGLGRLLTPERASNEPREMWYLTGAWLLGATMNAVMTWWAVSTVLLSHELGNEVLGREQLLHIVPVFVAVLVWLTRILFIGAVTMAGERLLHGDDGSAMGPTADSPARQGSGQQRPAYAATGGSTDTRQNAAPEKDSATVVTSQPGQQPVRASNRPARPRTGAARQRQVAYRTMRASGHQRR